MIGSASRPALVDHGRAASFLLVHVRRLVRDLYFDLIVVILFQPVLRFFEWLSCCVLLRRIILLNDYRLGPARRLVQMRCRLVGFVLAQLPFEKQVIRGSYVVVPVSFYALYAVVGVKVEFIEHLLVDCVVDGHDLFAGEETCRLLVLELFVPGVSPHISNRVASVGISLQNFADEMGAVGREELGDFVITGKNFLIQIGRFRVFKW